MRICSNIFHTHRWICLCEQVEQMPRGRIGIPRKMILTHFYTLLFFFSFVYERRRVAVIAAANVVAVAVALIHIYMHISISIYVNRAEQ